MDKITNLEKLEAGEYYKINGTKKILYWDGKKWMKPIKDSIGSYSGLISEMSNQPKFLFGQLSSSKEIN